MTTQTSQGENGIEFTRIWESNWDVVADFIVADDTEQNTILANWRNGNITMPDYIGIRSPDVIGKDGNMPHNGIPGETGNNEVNFPSIVTPLEDGQGLKPINWDDYKDFVDEANQNYTDDPTDQETQQQLWDDFKDPYIIETTDNPTNPDNPDNPVDPDSDYVPDFDEDITPDTVIDDVVLDDIIDDVIPDQPDIPDKPDLTPGEIEQNLDVSVSGDITDIFPFASL